MKIVGPFAAARQLDPATGSVPATPPAVTTWQALDRVTGMPALVYVLPYGSALPKLPDSPLLLPYSEKGSQEKPERLSYAACDLPPTAQMCSDPKLLTQMGLRALMALHEAGVVHGAVGPQQFWEDGGELLLSGAGLPWSEALPPYRAPEGGRSVAADLYAFGVTLLRLGPLPVGLSDLLSPYPAQRPSARDALALMNAGPPLPPQRVPLLVDAPRVKLPEAVVSEVEPLPLVADPDFRAPDIDLQDTVLVPDTQSRLDRQRREQLQPRRVADLPPVMAPVPPAAEPVQGNGPVQEGNTGHNGPRVVKIKVAAQQATEAAEPPLEESPHQDSFPAPSQTEEDPQPTVTPKLGLADAMPVRGRVLVRPNDKARSAAPRPDPLQGVLREVKPSEINYGELSYSEVKAPSDAALPEVRPPERLSSAGFRTEVPRPVHLQSPPAPAAPATPEAVEDKETEKAAVQPIPAQQGKPTQQEWPTQEEWVEEWSAQGLVYSTLPPEAAPPIQPAPPVTGLEVTASAVADQAASVEVVDGPQVAVTEQAVAVEEDAPLPIEEPAPQSASIQPTSDQSAPVHSVPTQPAGPPVGTLPSRREFKPVKMAWNPDGSWQVKHDDAPDGEDADTPHDPVHRARAVVDGLVGSLRQGLQHWQQRDGAAPVAPKPAETARPESSAAALKGRLGGLLRRKESNRERLLARSVALPRPPSLQPEVSQEAQTPEPHHRTPDYFLPDAADDGAQQADEATAAPSHPAAVPVADLIVLSPETMPELSPGEEATEEAQGWPAGPQEGAASHPDAVAVQDLVVEWPTNHSPAASPGTARPAALATPSVRAVRHSQAEPLLFDPNQQSDQQPEDEHDIKPVVRADTPEPAGKKAPLPFPRFGRAEPAAEQGQGAGRLGFLAAIPRWWWLVLLALLLLGLLLWGLSRRNAQVGGHITPPGCCSLQVQVYSPEGERLSVPVDIVAVEVPAGSRLSLGSSLGRAPGAINTDVPGHYRLGLKAESYQQAQVDVDLPRTTPLNITLQ